ncbi:GNAT family N-acetyltransferase [Bacillus rhizoplanae]|uniref:GNAT family N-acetyltransferase n=1 Tax=Bacillus rhizoplanae TaxID=2880966 RepID=UPI003D1C3FD3
MEYENIAEKYSTLTTERLRLRPLKIQDAADVFEYASDPEVTTYTVWYPHEKLQDSQMFIQSILHQYENEEMAAYGIELKKKKKIIGTCGFIEYDKNHHKAELAYALSKNYWRQGFATEAAKAFIEKLARKLHLQNVQGIAQFKVEMNCHRICKNIFVARRIYVLFGCFVVS